MGTPQSRGSEHDAAFAQRHLDFLQALTRGEISRQQWLDWLANEGASLQTRMNRRDWLRLKFRPYDEAKAILGSHGWEAGTGAAFCEKCGAEVINIVPGQTTQQQIRAFAKVTKNSGFFRVEENDWVHPGRYCVNGCTCVLVSYREVSGPGDSGE